MDFDQNRAGPRKGSVALEKIGGPPAKLALDGVNQKVYNTHHQMTVRTDKSESSRYSPAYATGR